MATPKRLFEEARLAQASQVPAAVIFQRTAQWDGVKIGHYRLAPGESKTRLHRTNHVFAPLAGTVTVESPEMTRQLKVGDIGVTPAGKSFGDHWEGELEYVGISLAENFIARAIVDFSANQRARLVPSCGAQDALMLSIVHQLAKEVDAELPTGRLYAESLVNTLAVHLLRHYSTDSLVPDMSFGGLPAHKLRRVVEFMHEHLDRDLTLTEIAEAIDLSQYHFARAFKQTTGQAPIQFLMQRRVEAAKQLLTASDLPIAEVALRTGFKNQSHFTTLFRKSTALTPRAFRNQQA